MLPCVHTTSTLFVFSLESPRTSIAPAMSRCAHRTAGCASPSFGSISSTNALRKSAAVHDPASLLPIWKSACEMDETTNSVMDDDDARCIDQRWRNRSVGSSPRLGAYASPLGS